MPIRDDIAQALVDAVKHQDKRRTSTLRLIQAAIKDRDIAHRSAGKDPVTDADVLEILTRMVKQRRESAQIYEQNGRADLAQEERHEIAIIEEFLPKPLDEAELKQACEQVVREIGAEGLRDMGRCMNALKERYPGRMDFSKASGVVRELLK
ncbi:GatB/YqeY domain-containing protein [bacterium SGD-2]|jgi:Uncharacterized conserved protein|nr:GatB/YqeY domain-containing protein [bacterium SGD-2]